MAESYSAMDEFRKLEGKTGYYSLYKSSNQQPAFRTRSSASISSPSNSPSPPLSGG